MTTRIAITSYLFIGVAMLLLPCSMVVAAELMEVARACISDVKNSVRALTPASVG